jgi:hypothetical protein
LENRCRFAVRSRLTIKCTPSWDPSLPYHGDSEAADAANLGLHPYEYVVILMV